MSTYKASLPSTPSLAPAIPSFFAAFYATSDSPSSQSHTDYADAFTPDATLIMGTRKVVGHDDILSFRKSLWAGIVQSRLHTLQKIFPWGEGSKDEREVMVYGNVKYGLKDGKGDMTVDWAGRALLVRNEKEGQERWRMKFYQVYLDSAPLANAAKESKA